MSYCRKITIFQGNGDTFYRIPGIVVSKSGVLVAYCEERDSKSDWANINLVYRRSTDGGKTWEVPRTLTDGWSIGLTVNNPVMISDRMSGKIHALYTIEYGVGKQGGVFYTYSSDDGMSWSPAVNLTNVTSPDIRNVIATGPGHGIQLQDGTLLVPVWMVLKTENQPLKSHHPAVVSTLYSKDFGKSWKLGELIHPTETVTDPNESTLVELSDGRVMINSRNVSKAKYRAVSISPTGYDSWSPLTQDHSLPDPICFGSLARYNKDTILFSNCASPNGRLNLTVKISYDNGTSWTRAKRLNPSASDTAGYSDIAVNEDQWIYVLAEAPKDNTYSINLYKFNMRWAMSRRCD